MRGSALTLPLVTARHLAWARRDQARALVWGDRLGYEPRVPARNRIELVDPARKAPEVRAAPATSDVGVLEEGTAVAACARFLGLRVRTPDAGALDRLVNRAVAERWGLVAGSPGSVAKLSPAGWGSLAAFVRGGGVLFLADVISEAGVVELGDRLGVKTPRVETPATPSAALAFPGSAGDVAGLLAGLEIETSVQGRLLRGGGRPLALSLADGERQPSVVELSLGKGRVLMSSFPGRLEGDLSELFGPELGPVILPPMMILKQVYGALAWQAPALLANFTVDDPALREGLLGLPYADVVRVARGHDFHVTVATIPAELGLAQPAVLSRLHKDAAVLSACYHGWNHDGYEFYRSSGRNLRFRARSLDHQRLALRRAAEAGRLFAQRTGHALDRVMVFPHGLGPAAILPDLQGLGFVATCNLDNRYPLEAEVPAEPARGLLPADTAWGGFPLLWRRLIDDGAYTLDLFLGRPALTFEHRRALGSDLPPFVERAEELHRFTRGAAAWRSLEEVARHAYLQRLDPDEGWQVLMTANEVCLHNPDPWPRNYRILRPNLPAGCSWETEGEFVETDEGPYLTVPPAASLVLRLASGCRLPRPPGDCSVFPA